MTTFKAILIDKVDDQYRAEIADVNEADLPEGEVTVAISHSTLNYKDALAITGKSPVVRRFPMIPGIDFAGEVEADSSGTFKPGDKVVLNGWGLGETRWGGLAEKARVDASMLVPLPDAFTPAEAMAIGTAGYTAALCVMALEQHGITPESGPILVTGANGGVGSVAIALLAKKGFSVIASTGRPEQADYLKSLGASEIIARAELSEPGRPLGKERWAAAVDAVGSHTLANVCAGTNYSGIVAACGLAQGMDFPASVAPFILRGVTLAGIDSVMAPMAKRIAAWKLLAEHLDKSKLASMTRAIKLKDCFSAADDLLAGKIRGRLVVEIQ